MRATLAFAAGLLAAGLSTAALAEDTDLFGSDQAVALEELDHNRGGTESISNSLIQGNETDLSGTNSGDVSVGSGGAKYSGTIAPATVTGNHGITAVMQNTGDLVNINNATSVNVYLR
jgi:hypothetical protein